MSGIAGILRRDGREVPEKWVNVLEQSLLQSGDIPTRFEASIPIQTGNVELILVGSSRGADPRHDHTIEVVDGDTSGECAIATWNQETLELNLSRQGSGLKSLYWFDLSEVGDGLVFCTNPLPLFQICHECELQNEEFSQGVHDYLQLGFAIEGGSLFSPLCSIPLKPIPIEKITGVHTVQCDLSPNIAEDVRTLVQLIGKPFGDINLLSKLWQYRAAKNDGVAVLEGLKDCELNQKTFSEKFKASHFLKRILPINEVEQLHHLHYNDAKRIEFGTIANYVGVEIEITEERPSLLPVEIPLSSWLRNAQSSLGQLAGDTLLSSENFEGLPIEHSQVREMFESHRSQSNDYSELLFSLLTLVLWHQLVRA